MTIYIPKRRIFHVVNMALSLKSIVADCLSTLSLDLVRVVVEYARPPTVSDILPDIPAVPDADERFARVGVIATFIDSVELVVWLDTWSCERQLRRHELPSKLRIASLCIHLKSASKI